MKNIIYLLLPLIVSCKALPKQDSNYSKFTEIPTGDGPEDMVVDSVTTFDRLLIVCDERRKGKSKGTIWEYDFAKQSSRELDVILPDLNYSFHPHGVSIFQKGDTAFLFVVNHIKKTKHEVIRFRVFEDSLVYEKSFRKGFKGKPNDVFAIGENEFYYSNYKMFFGSLVYVKDNVYTTQIRNFNKPNGVHVLPDSSVYVSTTFGDKIFRCEKNSEGNWAKQEIAKVKGGDNFEAHGDSLLVTSHPKFGKFICHYFSKKADSPSLVYLLHPVTGEKKVIYSNDGSQISACSTGLMYQGKLYLAQVFQPFILVCE